MDCKKLTAEYEDGAALLRRDYSLKGYVMASFMAMFLMFFLISMAYAVGTFLTVAWPYAVVTVGTAYVLAVWLELA